MAIFHCENIKSGKRFTNQKCFSTTCRTTIKKEGKNERIQHCLQKLQTIILFLPEIR